MELANSWLEDPALNAVTIQGAVDFLRGRGIQVGVYSMPHAWREIVADWQTDLPTWLGETSLACDEASSLTAGPLWLVQHVDGYQLPQTSPVDRGFLTPPT